MNISSYILFILAFLAAYYLMAYWTTSGGKVY